MLIVITTAITYTSYSMNQVTQLAETIGVQQEIKEDKFNESFDVVSVNIVDNQFNMTVKNTGDVPVHLTRFWIENTTDSSWPISKYDIDMSIAPGNTIKNIGQDVGLTALATQSYHAQIISERGNQKEMFLNTVGDSSIYTRVSASPAVMPTGFQTTVTLEVINTGTTQLLNLQPEMVSITTPNCSACIEPFEEIAVNPTSFDSLSPGDIAVFEWVYSYTGENGDDVVFEAGILNDARTDTATVTLQTVETSLNADIALESGGLGDANLLGDHILIFHMETTTDSKYQMYSGSAEGGADGEAVSVDHDTSVPHFMTNNQTETNAIPGGDWTLALMMRSEPVNDGVSTGLDLIFHFEDGDDVNPDDSTGDSSRDLVACGVSSTTEYIVTGNDDAFEEAEDDGDVKEDDDKLEFGVDIGDLDERTVGLRFQSINIQPDETIVSADVEFSPRSDWINTGSDVTNLRIYGEFNDSPADFNGGDYSLSTGRTLTTAYVDWMDIGDWEDNIESPETTTPNLAPIIEEIVSESGWDYGSDELVLIFYNHPDSPSTKSKVASSYNDGEFVPTLRITYGVGNPPDWIDNSGPHGSGSYLFDGDECFESSNDVSSTDENHIGGSDTTTSLWFKATQQVSGEDAYLVNWEESDEHYRIGIRTNGDVFYEVQTDTDWWDFIECESDDQRYDDGNWYFVIAKWDSGGDRCEMEIYDTTGTITEPRENVYRQSADNTVTISNDRWQVATNKAKDGNFFTGYIDDIMHWNSHDIADGEMPLVARTNYGDGAHRFIVNVDGMDGEGGYLRDIYDSVTYLDAKFADPKGGGVDDDYAYSQVNMTLSMPSGVTVASHERLDLYFDAQGDESGVWEALDGDIKIDDTSVGTPYPSLLEIQPPERAFPTYYEHSPEDEFVIFVSNTGSDGIFLTYQGTRVSFNGTDGEGAYAGLIHSVNGTGGNDGDWWNLNDDRDSMYIPRGERGQLYFHEATDIPSDDESGNLMIDGTYDTTVWLNGYSDQGESFLRSIVVGAVQVKTP